jgi:hypothetical protein
MDTAAVELTHHVAHAPHITVDQAQAVVILIEIFRGLEPCDLLELSSRRRSSTAGSPISAEGFSHARSAIRQRTKGHARTSFSSTQIAHPKAQLNKVYPIWN